MYILIKDSIPLGNAILASAHASLAAYRKFQHFDEVQEWLSSPFYKVVCRVNEKEFNNAKNYDDNVILSESALDVEEVAIAFKPRHELPKSFRFYRLFK